MPFITRNWKLVREHAMRKADNYDPEQAKLMGYSLIFHTTEFPVADVVRTYHQKDIVEKVYRELKSTVNLHPIRKSRMSHIKAHVKICYMAYSIPAYLQYKLKPLNISAVYALEQLQSVYQVHLKSEKDNFNWTKTVTLKNEQKKILKALGM